MIPKAGRTCADGELAAQHQRTRRRFLHSGECLRADVEPRRLRFASKSSKMAGRGVVRLHPIQILLEGRRTSLIRKPDDDIVPRRYARRMTKMAIITRRQARVNVRRQPGVVPRLTRVLQECRRSVSPLPLRRSAGARRRLRRKFRDGLSRVTGDPVFAVSKSGPVSGIFTALDRRRGEFGFTWLANRSSRSELLEAPPGFKPGMEVLQI